MSFIHISAFGRVALPHICMLGLLAAICFASAGVLMASTRDEYRDRTERARSSADALFQRTVNGSQNSAFERGKINEITNAVPAAETLEWPGGSVETGNQWLTKMLDEFSAEPDVDKRRAKLTGISERLLAIGSAAGGMPCERGSSSRPSRC